LTDFTIGAYATYEVDIWHKLHTAKKAAVTRYLATVEGKNFVLTNLVAEVANSYYECKLWTTNSNCKTKYSLQKKCFRDC
jgi:outer membrane protein TolC